MTETKPRDASFKPKRVLDVKAVTQVDVLEQYSILLVLQDKTLYSYSMEALEAEDGALSAPKRGRKISGATFFKIGIIDGQHLVCCVRTTSLSATIKVYKPMDSMTNTKGKRSLARMIAGGQEVLRPHKVSVRSIEVASLLIDTFPGVLHPHRNLLNSFPPPDTVRWMRTWLRDCHPGHSRHTAAPRPSRHVTGLRRHERQPKANPRGTHQPQLPPLLFRLLILRQQTRLASSSGLEDRVGRQPISLCTVWPLHTSV